MQALHDQSSFETINALNKEITRLESAGGAQAATLNDLEARTDYGASLAGSQDDIAVALKAFEAESGQGQVSVEKSE